MDAKPLVFVVDDDPIQLGVLEQAFASLRVPWDTRFFQDPSDVMLELRKHPGALMVTDWMMPEMSGLDLCRQVRDDTWHGKGFHYCILLTSRRSARDAVQGLDEAHEYLVKPVDPKRLATRIQAGLRYSQASTRRQEPAGPPLADALARRSALHFLDTQLETIARGKELWIFLCVPEGLDIVGQRFGAHVHGQILAEWTRRIHAQLRPEDLFVPWLDGSFLGACPDSPASRMAESFERIRRSVEAQPFSTDAGFFSGNLCAGLAGVDSEELDSWLLIHLAEEALSQARQQGPGTVVTAPLVGAPIR
jgi:PleD family two-component response regulator